MKGRFHPKNNLTLNPSGNESIRDVIDRVSLSRRRFIMTAVGTSVLTVLGDVSIGGFLQSVDAAPIPKGTGFAGIGFKSIPPNLLNPATGFLEKDLVSVPEGYTAKVLIAWEIRSHPAQLGYQMPPKMPLLKKSSLVCTMMGCTTSLYSQGMLLVGQ